MGEPGSVRGALVELYRTTNGQQWANNANWLSDESICTWNGVSCLADGSVTRLELVRNNLRGTLPQRLAYAPFLVSLNISVNAITGTIPPHFTTGMPNITSIHFDTNQVSGTLPTELGALTRLRSIYAHRNQQLSGVIPSQIGRLSQLQRFFLDTCRLSGTLPSQFVESARFGQDLEGISLYDTRLSGTLPSGTFRRFRRMAAWLGGRNHMSGTIPTEIALRSDTLQQVFFDSTRLSGSLPSELGLLSRVFSFWVANSRFTGTLPASLANLTAIRTNQNSQCVLRGALNPDSRGQSNFVRPRRALEPGTRVTCAALWCWY